MEVLINVLLFAQVRDSMRIHCSSIKFFFTVYFMKYRPWVVVWTHLYILEARWHSVRVQDSEARGPKLDTCLSHVVSMSKTTSHKERGGIVVERWTPNREVLGSIPTGIIELCP